MSSPSDNLRKQVGFESLSHFSYVFKKHFGYLPKDIRSQNIG